MPFDCFSKEQRITAAATQKPLTHVTQSDITRTYARIAILKKIARCIQDGHWLAACHLIIQRQIDPSTSMDHAAITQIPSHYHRVLIVRFAERKHQEATA